SAIADELPETGTRVHCAGEWFDGVFKGLPSTATLVIHRAILTGLDAERLTRLRRERPGTLRVVLCVGPEPRYADVQRWSALADVVLYETTASETIARHAAGAEGRGEAGRSAPRPRVDVVSHSHELRLALADVCQAAGFPARTLAECPV